MRYEYIAPFKCFRCQSQGINGYVIANSEEEGVSRYYAGEVYCEECVKHVGTLIEKDLPNTKEIKAFLQELILQLVEKIKNKKINGNYQIQNGTITTTITTFEGDVVKKIPMDIHEIGIEGYLTLMELLELVEKVR